MGNEKGGLLLLAVFACSGAAAAICTVAFIATRRLYQSRRARRSIADSAATTKNGSSHVWNDAGLWDSVAPPAACTSSTTSAAIESTSRKGGARTRASPTNASTAAWATPLTTPSDGDTSSLRDPGQPSRAQSAPNQLSSPALRYASSEINARCRSVSSPETSTMASPKASPKAPFPRPGSLITSASSRSIVSEGSPSNVFPAASVEAKEPSKRSVSELRSTLDHLSVDHRHCVEKADLVYLVKKHADIEAVPLAVPLVVHGASHDTELQREFLAAAAQLSESELREFVSEHVKEELASVRALPLEHRPQAFKRLCAEWHPDKCPAITILATEVFQRLQAQKASVLNAPA